ncbi:uncharacterized protein [Halyomorpha halys]|uniref:uncharacterized protein n=1 Tax=Halyomorpha halys TaxID=286706 RepID=UPI0006D4E451
MRLYVFLLFIVVCCGIEWKAVKEFKETFKEYSVALNTISSIEKILNDSKIDSERFLNKTFSENVIWNRMAEIKFSSIRFLPNIFNESCVQKIIDKERFKLSYLVQIFQIQVPLLTRALDIRERLNNINSSLDLYQGLAESKYLSCTSVNGTCWDETNDWLGSSISSLSCRIYPNCTEHSIRKRSPCVPYQFRCTTGQCIPSNYFCNGRCDCSECNDEPRSCVKSCSEFRCALTFRCVVKTKICDGINDCGDWSDEERCSLPNNTKSAYEKCPIEKGGFLCNNTVCINLEDACNGNNDCGDWSDEGSYCLRHRCSPECGKKGGVCLVDPKGSKCLDECPPGTHETSVGCSRHPERLLPTLLQTLEDTPRLVRRYAARLKYLKIKTILGLSQALQELVQCEKKEFSSISKMINFSSKFEDEHRVSSNVTVQSKTK